MKKAYDMNKGLDRLIESYKKPVKRGYTEALSKKAKSKTNLLKENYSVVDLETGERFGKFDSVDSAKSKAQRYSQQCSSTCAVVSSGVSDDSDFKVICGYKNGKERKVTNEALSPEAKANNEMIQKILSKSPSKLTAAEKQFLADNDLVRDNGIGGGNYPPRIRKTNGSRHNSISKGEYYISTYNQRPYANTDDVDQLNLLNKREDRWKARRDADRDILEPDGYWGSELQYFNKKYQSDIQRAKKYADAAKEHKDHYLWSGNEADLQASKTLAGDSRVIRDRARKSLENRPRFSESLEDDDYYDFVNDLATNIQKTSKKWKNRGVSSSDVVDALNELALKFEEASEYDEPDNEE